MRTPESHRVAKPPELATIFGISWYTSSSAERGAFLAVREPCTSEFWLSMASPGYSRVEAWLQQSLQSKPQGLAGKLLRCPARFRGSSLRRFTHLML